MHGQLHRQQNQGICWIWVNYHMRSKNSRSQSTFLRPLVLLAAPGHGALIYLLYIGIIGRLIESSISQPGDNHPERRWRRPHRMLGSLNRRD